VDVEGTLPAFVALQVSGVGSGVPARMLRAHQPLLLNWFRARGELSCGAVEGLNNKIRVVEVALYHNLGRLPELNFTHEFC
jgi:hypothetical protein